MNEMLTEMQAMQALDAEFQAILDGDVADAPIEPLCEEDFVRAEHRTCKCAMTYVHRKRHGALGTAVQIRLCCMARFIERQFGLPEGTFFAVIDFRPSWVWDCDHVSELEKTEPDGSKVLHKIRRGAPPRWLRERMVGKGIPIVNLREEDEAPGFGYDRGRAVVTTPPVELPDQVNRRGAD